jgi:hypothetical protein
VAVAKFDSFNISDGDIVDAEEPVMPRAEEELGCRFGHRLDFANFAILLERQGRDATGGMKSTTVFEYFCQWVRISFTTMWPTV